MSLRDRIGDALKAAMKAREAERVSTLRMVSAAIKDRDIAMRTEGTGAPAGEADILALLGKMVKQRQESAKIYRDGERPELARKEDEEIRVIEGFLPQQMTAAEVEAAIAAAVIETGATQMKDMGKVMSALKSRYTGQMDFGVAGPLVKARLG